jgi:ketosteroid isomerase-like protein
MYRIGAATVIVLVTSLSVFAQSAESDVRKANDALLASLQAADKAASAKILADDLRWMNVDGTVQSKSQRLAGIKPGGDVPKYSEVDIKVYGDTAVMMARIEFADGRKARNHRVFVKRGGQWQLVSHSATPMK